VRVVDPIRIVEIERHVGELAAEALGEMQTLFDESENFFEANEAVRSGRGIVDGDAADMHRRVGAFQIKEGGVHSRQLFHCLVPEVCCFRRVDCPPTCYFAGAYKKMELTSIMDWAVMLPHSQNR